MLQLLQMKVMNLKDILSYNKVKDLTRGHVATSDNKWSNICTYHSTPLGGAMSASASYRGQQRGTTAGSCGSHVHSNERDDGFSQD